MPILRPPSAVIFDLDGTLVQTRTASWEIFRGISNDFDLGVDDAEAFFDIFRDNFFAALRRMCRDEQQAIEVRDAFFARLETDYDPTMIPGMIAVVRTLAGHSPLCVLSSNTMAVLRRVLSHNDVSLCFSHVFGGDVVESKRTAIGQFLADATSGFGRLCQSPYAEDQTPRRVDPAGTVLVTDTVGDVREARAAGIRAVGVSWGMHGAHELTAAGAEFVALWPQELLSHLLGAAANEPLAPTCAVAGGPIPQPEHGCAATNTSACRCGGSCRVTDTAVTGTPVAGTAEAQAAAARRARRTVGAAQARRSAIAERAAARFGGARTTEQITAAVRAICS